MDVGRPTETTTCHRKILSRKYLINWRRRLERNERTTTAAGWSRDKYIVFETPQISYAFNFLCIVRKLQFRLRKQSCRSNQSSRCFRILVIIKTTFLLAHWLANFPSMMTTACMCPYHLSVLVYARALPLARQWLRFVHSSIKNKNTRTFYVCAHKQMHNQSWRRVLTESL